MKCICRRRTQALDPNGKVVTHDAGSVVEFESCPRSFEPLEGDEAKEIDFSTASKAELLEAEYPLEDLKDYIEKKFGKKAGNKGKEKTVALLLDCVYRAVDVSDLV